MADLRSTLKQISGTDIGGNEFTLEETDVQPYIDNPEIAALEADIAKARYGGSSINDPSPSDPMQGVQDPNMPQPIGVYEGPERGGKRPVDFGRRADFEKSIFKQLQSENIPDGNPFNLDPVASLNAISKQDLPDLFEREFQGQVTWQDRHLLDDDQKKYWMTAVKGYRAHVKSGLDSERAASIDSYNQMMNQFDNAAKEQSAIAKAKLEKVKRATAQREKARERGDKRKKDSQTELVDYSKHLTQERELIQSYLEADTAGMMKPEENQARLAELQSVREARQALGASINSRKVPKPKSAVTKVKADPDKRSVTENTADGKTIVRKKMPKRDGKTAVAEVDRGVFRSGPNKGKTIVKYSDGTTKILEYNDGSTAHAGEAK